MVLAQLVHERFDELAADLMECYGIRLDEAVEGAYPAPYIASLASQLPPGCRWRVSYDKDAWWTGDRLLAANLVNSLNGLIWGLSDKKSRGPRPKPIGPSWAVKQGTRGLRAKVMDRGRLVEELAKPRRRG